MLDLSYIPGLHDRATAHWHEPDQPAPYPEHPLEELVVQQHRANFDLWHEEDAARDPHVTDSEMARVKRAIDQLNQRRNDLAEQLDVVLLQNAGSQPDDAQLHSESPGLIIDRLSILSLKLFHTAEQISRSDVEEDHRTRNRDRLRILAAQRDDLAGCLCQLWADVTSGRRRFKLYRQLKMYNDATLNPRIYGAQEKT